MPVINIKMTKEDGGATQKQKEQLARGVAKLFSEVFNRSSANAVILIEEVDTDNYYIGEKSITQIRSEQRKI